MTHQVGLEFRQVDIEGTVKSQRGGNGWHNLTNETIQIGVGWPLNIEIASADVVNGFVVDHEGTVGMFQGGVSG